MITENEIIQFMIDNQQTYDLIDFDILGGELRQDIKSEQICKTLVVKTDKGIYVLVIPFKSRLDYKKAKKALGLKKIRLADNIKEVSGFEHGANGPVGLFLSKTYPIIFDKSFNAYDTIIHNRGKVGKTIKSNRTDLYKLINAREEILV